MSAHFIGRDHELQQLGTYFHKKQSNFIVIKGRRRIGKSRLIEEFAQDKTFYKFVGIAPEPGVTAQIQRDDFARRLKNYFPELPSLKADDWAELFALLGEHLATDKIIILLDEISWMAQGDPSFLGKLKNAWDELFKKNNNLMLVVCGSVSSWVNKNLLSSTGFVGRVHYVMTLKELPLSDCGKFWLHAAGHTSAFDQLKYLAVSGGVPLYLEAMDPQSTVDDNIRRLCFDPGGLLFREFNNIFHDLFDKRSGYYQRIVEALVKGPADMSTICANLGISSGGVVSEYLQDLVETGFVARDYAWSFQSRKRGKLSRYRLCDNYVRFYLRYVDQDKDRISRDYFRDASLAALPAWSSVMGLQLENLVLNNREAIWHYLGMNPNDIVNDGPYFQSHTKSQVGCQVDYLIQTQYNNLFVCEGKFSRNDIKLDIIQEMKRKLSALKKPANFSAFPILIVSGDVSDAVIDSGYFTKIVDLRTLLIKARALESRKIALYSSGIRQLNMLLHRLELLASFIQAIKLLHIHGMFIRAHAHHT